MSARSANLFTTVFCLFLLALFLSALARAERPVPIPRDGVVAVKSAYSVAETIARLKQDIATKGIKFFDEIDHAKLAADAGIKLGPSTLLIFGNPPLGTQFITSNPNSGLDWPVRAARAARRQGGGLGRLHRLWLDRAAPRHKGPRGPVQDGINGHRLDHGERGPQIAARPLPVPRPIAGAGAMRRSANGGRVSEPDHGGPELGDPAE